VFDVSELPLVGVGVFEERLSDGPSPIVGFNNI